MKQESRDAQLDQIIRSGRILKAMLESGYIPKDELEDWSRNLENLLDNLDALLEESQIMAVPNFLTIEEEQQRQSISYQYGKIDMMDPETANSMRLVAQKMELGRKLSPLECKEERALIKWWRQRRKAQDQAAIATK